MFEQNFEFSAYQNGSRSLPASVYLKVVLLRAQTRRIDIVLHSACYIDTISSV